MMTKGTNSKRKIFNFGCRHSLPRGSGARSPRGLKHLVSKLFSLLPLALSLWADAAEDRTIPVGGQAVIEGVLMKGPEHWGLVVREPGGSLWGKAWLGATWLKRGAWKLPIVRGFANMVEMMRVGTKALSLSAERALGDEENFTILDAAISIGFAVVLVIGLFIMLPMRIADTAVEAGSLPSLWRHVIEGVMRCCVFVAYIALASLMRDIRRVFAYHGAEHKTINAWESEQELTVESVARCSRIHRRCGTSFLVIVAIVSIVVFSAIGGGSIAWRIGSRVALLPLVIGISYEFIKAASRSCTWGKVLIKPALALQFLTTREPDESMLDVAIRSLDIALDPSVVLSDIEERGESFSRLDAIRGVSAGGSVE